MLYREYEGPLPVGDYASHPPVLDIYTSLPMVSHQQQRFQPRPTQK
jgi:hypothetical protein